MVSHDFEAMNDYAQSKFNESNIMKEGYNKDREPYSLTGNNCATFASDVLKQDKNVKSEVSGTVNNTPKNIADAYRSVYDKVDYSKSTGTIITPTKTLGQKIKDFFGL